MPCPRCDGHLQTFVLEGTEGKAVVCESCGFTDIPAGHRPEGAQIESWDTAVARFDGASMPPARTERTDQTGEVPTAEESDAAIEPNRLEETIPIAPTLGDGPDPENEPRDGLDPENEPRETTDS